LEVEKMAKFLTARDTASEIEKIINNAQKRLVLISPFVKIPESLLQNLKVADSRKVKITLVYGKEELNPDERKKLEQLNDKDVFSEAVNEAKLMVYISEKEDLNGYCIRCAKEIPYDLNRPLCLDCFRVWVQYEDHYYEERFCHTCGESVLTSKAKPQCHSCYRKSLI